MGTQQKSRSLERTLERKQRKHEVLLARVEKATVRLERRKAKLLALESQLAALERRVAEPRRELARKGAISGFRRAQLIFNPAAGKDQSNNAMRLAQVVSCLRAHGIEATIGVKTSGRTARELAREAKRSKLPLVVVAAGDGTIEDVASQLIGTEIALGIVPLGTMNNLARSLGIPLDIDEACALIGMGATRHIDVGHVFSNDKPEVEYFLEGAGAGLAAIGTLAGQGFEKQGWRVFPRMLRKFFDSKPGTIRVAIDDTIVEASTRIVTVSNGPMMGNNMLIAPEAKMDDGLLDVVLYDGMNDAALIKHFMAAASGNPEKLPTYRARNIRITADQPLPANSDKDVTARRRIIEIEIVPRSLTVIAGNGIGLTIPVVAAVDVAVSQEYEPQTNGAGQEQTLPDIEPAKA